LLDQEASDAILDPIWRIEAICTRHRVPPGAAALPRCSAAVFHA